MNKRILILIGTIVLIAGPSSAQTKMDRFLNSCMLGLGAGALVGLGSLAFSDDPGSKTGNVAKGASLGLYAGIGLGLYLVNRPDSNDSNLQPVLVIPVIKESQLESVQIMAKVFEF